MQENKQKVQENYKEEFQVPRDLVKYVIGQKGYNIQEARKIPDIVSIHVTEKEGGPTQTVTILAKVRENSMITLLFLFFFWLVLSDLF